MNNLLEALKDQPVNLHVLAAGTVYQVSRANKTAKLVK